MFAKRFCWFDPRVVFWYYLPGWAWGEGSLLGEIFISHASADAASAARIAEGLRQAGHRIFLDSDREDGIAPGAEWQKTLLREIRLCDAMVFVNSRASQASMWCHSELVLATELGKRVYSLDLDPGVQPHPLLQSLQGIRLETTIDASIQRLTDNLDLDGLARTARFKWQRGRSPYPGLAPMDVADAGVFFGREKDARDLVARVDAPLGQPGGNLVVVIGPSGAGKSSLVRAGLVARLAVPRSGWAVADPFEPGTRPLDRLTSRLVALVPGRLTDGECRNRLLDEGIGAIGEWLADHIAPPAKRMLITVDQAEQLATVTPPSDAEEFLTVLGRGLGAGSPVTVVMTVRSDRFDEIQRLPVVGPMIHSPFVIAPMSRSQLAAVIEGPAQRADLTFAPGLAGRLVEDAARGSSGDTTDALPFLAFTLREMYDLVVQEDRRTFTDADYERVGGVKGAITRRTEDAESLLPPDSGPVLEHLLPRFVTLSEDRLPAGRPVPRGGLTPAEQAIVEKLEDQRLLTGTGDTVRLAHEQLITAWPRLVDAVDARRGDLLLQARLERQADDWEQGNGGLLGRDATTTASAWLAERAERGTDHSATGKYIRASHRALRRRRAGLVGVLCTIVVLALAASAVAVVARIQGSDAVSQSHLAQSEEMAAEATNLFSANAPLAMLLSLQAYERAPTLQARSALIEAAGQPLGDLLAEGGGSVEGVAFSPNGQLLAAGDTGGHVGLWDTASGRRIATLDQGNAVYCVAFSPNGQMLAVGDDKGHVGLWNIASRRRIALTEGPSVASVAFSPNGQMLAAGDYGGHVGLWDIASRRRIAALTEGPPVTSVAFSPNGQMLAAGDTGGHVGLWNLGNRRRIAALPEGAPVASVTFSPDGQMLAVGDHGGHTSLWNAASRRRITVLTGGGPVYSVAFSPDGRTLAAGDLGGQVGLWDTAGGQRIATLAEGRPVYSVAFSADGRTLAAGAYGGEIGLWDTGSGQRTATLVQGGPVYTAAFSPNGQTLAVGGPDGEISLWDTGSGQPGATLVEGSPVVSLAFSPDGRTLAAGDTDGQVSLWDTATGRRAVTLAEGSPVYSVAFSPDGQTLAAGDLHGVRLWDTESDQRIATLAADGPVDTVAFSPNGQTLAAGDTAGEIRLWNAASGGRIATLAEGSPVASVAFSPDGQTLAAGDTGGHVSLWDTATGGWTGTTLAEGSAVYSVAFSPNGQTLAIGDSGGDVSLWDTESGRWTVTLAEGGAVYAVAFSPNGQTLAIGDLSGDVALLRQGLWSSASGFLSRIVCGEVRGNMTQAQWKAEAPGQPYQKTCSAYP